MFNGIFFFTYIFAGFVGFLTILLVVLLARYWTSGNKRLLAAIRNFMICTAVIDALYFYMDYRLLKTGAHVTSPLLRILDIVTFIGQVYFWAAYIREKSQLEQQKFRRFTAVSFIFCILCLIASLISYGFLMDDYYFVPEGTSRLICIGLELLISVLLTSITVFHLIKGLSELVQKTIRVLVTIISILITIDGLWNALLVIILMNDAVPQNHSLVDPTALFILLINLFTILLVYREDFSALFRIEASDKTESNGTSESDPYTGEQGSAEKGREVIHKDIHIFSLKDRLDFIAQAHSLTEREREVMELAYEGLTNPEIAEELIISKYTVKRHMHNIFEKLDISTRMELVHLVNRENGPGGPL